MSETCQTCLKIGDVCAMSSEEEEFYRTLTTQLEWKWDKQMHICIFCRSLLKRFAKFIKQCQKAARLLNKYLAQDSKPPAQLISSHDMRHAHSTLQIEPVTEGVCDMSDDDDIPLVMLNRDDRSGERVIKPLTDFIDAKVEIDENVDYKMEDDSLDSDRLVDSGQLSDVSEFENVTENSKQGNRKAEKRINCKKKKVLREGFTSRMVQETEEYVVIKLTNEQVLQEMMEHSKTEKYRLAPYKCEQCVKGFNFEDVLRSHMRKHSTESGTLQCEICTQYCPSVVSLRGHMKSHTTRYKCKVCALVRLSRQHVMEHYAISHTAAPPHYACQRCHFTTSKRTVMQHHVRSHASPAPLACHCGKLYRSRESLRIHAARHDAKKRLECEHCSLSFVYASQLQKHVQAVHVRRDYYCVECDVVFKSMETLKLHFQKAKRHRDPTSYKFICAQCPERFISRARLSAHEARAHYGQDARVSQCPQCPQCARTFSSRDALRVHTRRAHAPRDAPSLPCGICNRMFSRAGVLKIHMRTHTGERPHVCACGAAFAQPATLRAHQAAKHKK